MTVRILTGDCREVLPTLPDASVHCCVTSPPYWGLRDYGHGDQLGLEPTPDEYVAKMVAVFREVWRVLRDDGTLWLNLGDSYCANGGGGERRMIELGRPSPGALSKPEHLCDKKRSAQTGLKPKDLVGIPWRVAFALQADGWWLRQDIIWSKPNPMPESVTDRCTKAHEYIFLLTKSARYYYDANAIAERGGEPKPCGPKNDASRNDSGRVQIVRGDGHTRNRRSVWTVPMQPYSGAHFAVFPPALIRPCILAGCPMGGTVLDPFGGAGTTALVAEEEGRNSVLIELNEQYADMARTRTAQGGLFCHQPSELRAQRRARQEREANTEVSRP
ncbi:MAG TPA: site-specific DNA-methyltransferase [Phycisphaerae bacterium]|nr:site-specific DNA-methyltransferase [Phycisphaerae bacterium]